MSDIRTRPAQVGVTVELADLGDWGASTLVSEYDPLGPVIRINQRAIERYRAACGELSSCDVRGFIDLAIAHELYHHAEATGEIARIPDRAERERAADAYARERVVVDTHLAAFTGGVRA